MLFRSSDLGDSWKRIWDPSASTEADVPDANLTTIAFNVPNTRIIFGSGEGIHYGPAAGGNWLAANMPERSDPGFGAMKAEDGRYPWIGIIREYPFNTNFMLAGIGDLREKPVTRFGLGTLLRSSDGGQNWDAVAIDGAEADEVVYDIDYLTCSDNKIHVIVSTGNSLPQLEAPTIYKGAIYYSNNIFEAALGENVQFVKISTRVEDGAEPALSHLVNSVALCNNPVPEPIQVGSTVYLWTSRCVYENNVSPAGGIFRAVTALSDLSALLQEPNPESSPLQPDWKRKFTEHNLGRLAVKSQSTRFGYEMFLGKERGEHTWLAVTNEVLANSGNAFRKIIAAGLTSPFGVHDPGYRELDSNGYSQLKFGSIDINPEDPSEHPAVYGCWSYGPLKAPGGGAVASQGSGDTFPILDFDSPRYYRQIFTTKAGQDASGDDAYVSRGMDEVFFNGQQAVFKPDNANVVLVGCGDNGLLRTTNINDNPVKWSQRRLATSQWYQDGNGNTLNQFIYHLAFHPQNANTVIASAGTRNLRPNEVGQGGLLKNTLAGAGGPEDWEIIAGGPNSPFKGLPDAMIQAFVFDVKDDSRGVFVAARNRGIYYARINTNGTLDPTFNSGDFVQITDPELTNLIPANIGRHHNYSRLAFDPDVNTDYLYVARHWPSGGVFRLELKNNRANFDPTDCIERVDEVIRGRYTGSTEPNDFTGDKNVATDVINLLVTSTHVWAGVTSGHLPTAKDSPGENYTGGLIRWTKPTPPTPNNPNIWVIGGENKLPSNDPTSMTMAIGGLAEDPISSSIIAVTYRFSLRENNSADSDNPKLKGEDNYKLMNLWEITENGQQLQVTRLSNSITQHQWPDAVTMAFFPNNPDKIIMPTHGNGVWIGTYNGPPRKVAMPAESAQSDPRLPERFALHHNYPNPFNPTTMIKYDLPKAGQISITIFDMLGRKVRTLVNEQQEAGYHAVTWDGKNDEGAFAGSGLYFCRMHANSLTYVRKLTLLR